MGKKKEVIIQDLKLGKFVHGGQSLATSSDGKKILVWGGLPGEVVNVRVTKKRKSYLEGIVTEVIKPSDERIQPKEAISYLSTSPWQIMTYKLENQAKQMILEETFEREGIKNIVFEPFIYTDQQYGYRNKQEYGFWGDDEGVHIAHYVRGTHGKQIVQGSALADESINIAARAVRDELNRIEIWGGKLKTLVLRSNSGSDVVGALFVKEKLDFGSFKLPKELKGLDIYYSDPKSPASVPTEKIYSFGDIKLMDSIKGINIIYDVLSFFQVNLPMFEQALPPIKTAIENYLLLPEKSKQAEVVDMYSGVGTIGMVVGATKLIEQDNANVAMATKNVEGTSTKVIQSTIETALEHITSNSVVILDPPRAGLHKKVVSRIVEARPPMIVYLSCNPSTQARDIKALEEHYRVSSAQGFNFFPRTPHIELLVILELA